MITELYHCTNIDGLFGIIASQTFQPSFCLEKAGYLKGNMDFAFAMVSFADLLPMEVENHMVKFKSVAYFKMSKEWAIRNGIVPIIYYNSYNSPLSACVRLIIDKAVEEQQANNKKTTKFSNAVNILLSYLKQYKGCYWRGGKNEWSEETTFFTEREWRYIPLVENGEAYYLSPEEYNNEQFRNNKKQELIDHGYVLHFSIDDILEIGVSKEDILKRLVGYYKTNSYPKEWIEKTKIIKIYNQGLS